MTISIDDIKKLRELTGAGMMKAKEALVEADGDFEKAQEILRKAGAVSAAKKADREARNGLIEAYVHGGKIGVLVEINCETDFVARTDDFKTFARDIALQVAATTPEYLRPEDVPANVVEKERDFHRAELVSQKKPAEMIDKIVDGKLAKFYEGICLIKQPFVKDPDKTIENLTTELIGKLGENIVIRRFERIELGQL
jgi:elongation factor Ts